MELINRVVDECKPRVMYRTDECDVTEDELDKEMRKAEGSPEVNSPCSFDNKVVPGVEGGRGPTNPLTPKIRPLC